MHFDISKNLQVKKTLYIIAKQNNAPLPSIMTIIESNHKTLKYNRKGI